MLTISKDLKLPDDAVTQTFAILARRGAGKTYGAKVLAEEMLEAGHPIVVLDPIGVWYGLRAGADGTPKGGYPVVIMGGEHGDVPLEAQSGKIIADFLVSERVPTILDLSGLGEAEMQTFVGDLADRFYRANRSAVHWFVDEADEFAPQDARGGGPLWKCLGAMQKIVRRGRARGIGVTLITQRSAVLSKSVLTQTECLIAMQTTAPQDLKAIDDWLKYHAAQEARDKIIGSLTGLQQGEAILYSPGWLRKLERFAFRRLRTFDSSRTPKAGEHARAPKKLADVDLAALQQKVAATIEKAKADDPRELRKTIADLKKQLGAKPAAAPDPTAREKYEQFLAKANTELTLLRSAVKDRDQTIAKLRRMMDKVYGALEGLDHSGIAEPVPVLPSQTHAAGKNGESVSRSVPAPASTAMHRLAPRPPPHTGERRLGKPERQILTAFYWLRGENITPSKIGFYADYTAGSGSFNNALGSLRSSGLLSGWQLTDEGEATAESLGAQAKPTGQELREWLRRKLTGAENRFLDALIEAHPKRLSDEELSEATGYTVGSGSFNNALGRLRSIEAAEGYAKDGGPKAADVFFD